MINFEKSSFDPQAIASSENDKPSWEKNSSLCKRDLIIKGIALGVIAVIGLAAATFSMLYAVFPIGVVSGFPLGSLALGVGGAIINACLQSGIKEGKLFGRFKQIFDINLYHQTRTAKKVCEKLKKESFREIIKNYHPANLQRYGFITKEAENCIQNLNQQMDFLDKVDKQWEWDNFREVQLYKENPDDPKLQKVKERMEVVALKDGVIEEKWQSIRDHLVLPVLPEDEIKVSDLFARLYA